MIQFHGRPFLAYLVELLRDEGFERILLLTGYLSDSISDYFGDGSAFGVRIDYSATSADDATSERLLVAREKLDPTFLLLYCDNYWPMPFDALWQRYVEAGAPAIVTVYRNADGHTRDNVRIDGDGFVAEYDRSRTSPDLHGNEIGYAVLRRDLLDLLPDGSLPIEQILYPMLARDRRLSAFETDHRYYSVGSHERLPVTERFLARRPTVLLDRDGVLNRRPAVAEYICHPDDVVWLPGALEAVRRLSQSGVRLLVISNQAGIARGAMTSGDLAAVEERMRADIEAAGGAVEAFIYCPHGWDAGCACRKPKPGMLHDAQRRYDLDLTRTTFVGDDARDGEAALAAGCPFLLVDDDHSLLDLTDTLLAGDRRPMRPSPAMHDPAVAALIDGGPR